MITSAPNPTALLSRLDGLADPARLRLLALLEGEELGVSELAEILQLPQSTVSRHLKVLADLGYVLARSERTANFYRMANGELPDSARRLWELSREEIRGWPELEQDRLRLARRLERRSTREFFAGVAGEWERLRADLYGERFTLEALLALLPPEWTVADLACGSGAVTAMLAPHVARVVAVDNSPEMLEAARKRTRGRKNVELRQADLEALPLPDASVDAALLLLALTHVEAPDRVLAEMARIVRPGGRLVVVDLLAHDRDAFRQRLGQLRNGFAPAALARLLARAGGIEVACRALPTEPQAKGPALLLASARRAGPSKPTTTHDTPRRARGGERKAG
ncbi:MAG: metalloregulator ArsR/SmtB family transcription factor [Thermoanaerobaculia bacterium]